MKDSRIGESLWSIWDGDGYVADNDEATVYFTQEHIDVEEDVIKRALASSIQRDGISYSLGDSFKLVDASIKSHLWIGTLDQEIYPEICNSAGETLLGATLDNVVEATFVEVLSVD
jgi:hypothetical protein